MAGPAPRVQYLAGFSCPVGGLTAGGPRVLPLGAEVFLAAGRELVYVYDREARELTVSGGGGVPGPSCRAGGAGGAGPRAVGGGGRGSASGELVQTWSLRPSPAAAAAGQAVYRFPGPVWHLEVLALRGALLVLCARRGIYCLSLDRARR